MFFLESSLLLAPTPCFQFNLAVQRREKERAFDTSLMCVLKRRSLPFLCLSLPHFHSFIAHLTAAGSLGSGVLRARILALTSTVSVRRDVSFSFPERCFARCEPATNGRAGMAMHSVSDRGESDWDWWLVSIGEGDIWLFHGIIGRWAAGIGGSPKLGNPNENFRRHCSRQMGRNPLWPHSLPPSLHDSGSSALKPQTASCIPTFRAQTFRRTTDGGGGRQGRREGGREDRRRGADGESQQ